MPLPPLVEPIAALSDAERARTARHAVLAGLGEVGQRRLAAANVAVIGAGGLGSPVVLALAAAGIGTLTLIDDDVVEASNLQRQVMHRRADVGMLKTASATRVAADLSETVVVPVVERLTRDNAAALLAGADLVIDGSDLFSTRAAVAVGAESLGIPLVWGTVQEFDAQVTVFWNRPPAGVSPVVLADLYPPDSVGAVPTCADVGVLGALCIQVGGLLALEAVKLVAGIGEPLLGRVVLIDALRGRQTEIPLRPAQALPLAVHSRRNVGGDAAKSQFGASERQRTELTQRTEPPRRTEPPQRTDPTQGTDPPQRTEAKENARMSEQHAIDEEQAPRVPAQLTAEEMLAAQAAGATLLDVREPWETATGVVADSVVVPLADLLANPGQIDAEHVVVICEHGVRAAHAAAALAGRGISADILTGGLAAWRGDS